MTSFDFNVIFNRKLNNILKPQFLFVAYNNYLHLKMKFVKKDTNELILRKALFLKYGSDDINPNKPPISLLNWNDVSKLLKVRYGKLISLKSKFFNGVKHAWKNSV